MSALFRRSARNERVLVYGPGGREWERELDPGILANLLQRTLAGCDHDAGVQWEHAGQLGGSFLGDFWPIDLVHPAQMILKRGGKGGRFGLELLVDLPPGVELREYGEDLARALAGKPSLQEMEVEAAPEPSEERPSEDVTGAPEPVSPDHGDDISSETAASSEARPEPEVESEPAPEPSPALKTVPEPSRPVEQAEPEEAMEPIQESTPVEPVESCQSVQPGESMPVQEPDLEQAFTEPSLDVPEVEVVMPGERVEPVSGRQWQQESDDLFGLAGELHPDDLRDHGLEIQREDLPWLNPGDAIISPRRGPCRIKKVEDEAGQVVVKDENGRLVVLEFRELLAEFLFDDGN